MKALKIIGIVFILFVVLIAGLVYVGIKNFDNMIESAIETAATDITGVPVTIEDLNTTLTQLRGEINGLNIGNPAGYTTDHAFSLDKIAVQLNVEAMNGRTDGLFVIYEILIDGADVIYEESNITDSNLNAIIGNVRSKTSNGPNRDYQQQESYSPQQQPRFIVENFTFSNASVQLVSPEHGSKTVSIPTVKETNIGGDEGILAEELGAFLMETVYTRTKNIAEEELKSRVRAEARERIGDAIENNLSEEDKDKLDRVKSLLDR